MSGGFTRVGALLWECEWFNRLDPTARILWLALYTSPNAKRQLPGLWHGSVQTMADNARMTLQDTWSALNRLLTNTDVNGQPDPLVEFDEQHRVLRLTKLPDAGEWPFGPQMLMTWWRRFQLVPACAVRDAYVTTLRWLVDRGALEASLNPDNKKKGHTGKPSAAHEEIWRDTFGQVQIPVPRHRGKRRMDDLEPGTAAQPSLFDPRGTTPVLEDPSLLALPPGSDPGPNPSNQIKDSGGTTRGSTGEGEGEGDSFFSSGSGSGSGPSDPTASGASSAGDRVRPALALVPPLQPYDDLLHAIAKATDGKYRPDVREGTQAALCNTIRELEAARVGPADLAVVGRWLAKASQLGSGAALGIGSIGGDPHSRLSVWVAQPGNVIAALACARAHDDKATAASAHLAELKKQLGF